MGKFEKKKKKKSFRGILISLVLVIVLAALMLFVMPQVLYKFGDGKAENEDILLEQGDSPHADPESSGDGIVETDAASAAVAFPLLLEDGKLEVDSVFQFDGINPDCGNQPGNGIASITVKNLSDTHLERAEITLTAENGQLLNFAVTELPAGMEAMAFSLDNASAEADAVYTDLVCEAAFDADASMNADAVTASVDGIHVTLQNNTAAEIAELVVYCRSTLGDQYFGGITYTYTVNNLPANGTAQLDAEDCILGLAEVVRVEIK